MLKFFKSRKISSPLFVALALATLFLLGLFFTAVKIFWLANINQQPTDSNRYSFENTETADPFITKTPNLDTMLAGPIISQNDPSQGSGKAPVIIVLFSDFLCNYCQEQEKIIAEAITQYPDKIRLIWKDYPENDINSLSFVAAVAGRCANEQQQFWPYHDLLYQNADNMSQDKFLELAKELNLDEKKFKQCLTEEKAARLVRDNITEANALDITGIPFFYVNKQEVMGQITGEELKKIIELELKQNDQ